MNVRTAGAKKGAARAVARQRGMVMKKTENNAKSEEYKRYAGVIEDNLARNLAAEALPQEMPQQSPQAKPQVETQTRPASADNPIIGIRKRMDFFAFALLVAGLLFFVYNGVQYLKVCGKNMELDREITQLTNEYSSLYRSNEERAQSVVASVDLNHVYEVAVGQYGMVFPNKNEVIDFTYRNEGYVRQYSEASKAGEQSIFDTLLCRMMQ